MHFNIRKLIKETIELKYLCEVKIDIEDTKQRGFADEVGKMYKNSFAELNPINIYGKLGIKGAHGDGSFFKITFENGDVISAIKYTNPAFAIIDINGQEFTVKSNELVSSQFPDLLKKYYLNYKTAKAKIPSA